jgi:hypothetical protein
LQLPDFNKLYYAFMEVHFAHRLLWISGVTYFVHMLAGGVPVESILVFSPVGVLLYTIALGIIWIIFNFFASSAIALFYDIRRIFAFFRKTPATSPKDSDGINITSPNTMVELPQPIQKTTAYQEQPTLLYGVLVGVVLALFFGDDGEC